MSLAPGTHVGVYEVISLLGAGVMGEVYRARDGRLQRDVALKILPDVFASDPDRLARFEREAQVLAALNHPHIAAIYGFEPATDVGAGFSRLGGALVLELVEGPTLADRIAQGPMPVAEAVAIATGQYQGGRRPHGEGAGLRVGQTDAGPRARASGPRAHDVADDERGVHGQGSSSARRRTCRPSRRAARRWTSAPTSGRWDACCSRCCRGSPVVDANWDVGRMHDVTLDDRRFLMVNRDPHPSPINTLRSRR